MLPFYKPIMAEQENSPENPFTQQPRARLRVSLPNFLRRSRPTENIPVGEPDIQTIQPLTLEQREQRRIALNKARELGLVIDPKVALLRGLQAGIISQDVYDEETEKLRKEEYGDDYLSLPINELKDLEKRWEKPTGTQQAAVTNIQQVPQASVEPPTSQAFIPPQPEPQAEPELLPYLRQYPEASEEWDRAFIDRARYVIDTLVPAMKELIPSGANLADIDVRKDLADSLYERFKYNTRILSVHSFNRLHANLYSGIVFGYLSPTDPVVLRLRNLMPPKMWEDFSVDVIREFGGKNIVKPLDEELRREWEVEYERAKAKTKEGEPIEAPTNTQSRVDVNPPSTQTARAEETEWARFSRALSGEESHGTTLQDTVGRARDDIEQSAPGVVGSETTLTKRARQELETYITDLRRQCEGYGITENIDLRQLGEALGYKGYEDNVNFASAIGKKISDLIIAAGLAPEDQFVIDLRDRLPQDIGWVEINIFEDFKPNKYVSGAPTERTRTWPNKEAEEKWKAERKAINERMAHLSLDRALSAEDTLKAQLADYKNLHPEVERIDLEQMMRELQPKEYEDGLRLVRPHDSARFTVAHVIALRKALPSDQFVQYFKDNLSEEDWQMIQRQLFSYAVDEIWPALGISSKEREFLAAWVSVLSTDMRAIIEERYGDYLKDAELDINNLPKTPAPRAEASPVPPTDPAIPSVEDFVGQTAFQDTMGRAKDELEDTNLPIEPVPPEQEGNVSSTPSEISKHRLGVIIRGLIRLNLAGNAPADIDDYYKALMEKISLEGQKKSIPLPTNFEEVFQFIENDIVTAEILPDSDDLRALKPFLTKEGWEWLSRNIINTINKKANNSLPLAGLKNAWEEEFKRSVAEHLNL